MKTNKISHFSSNLKLLKNCKGVDIGTKAKNIKIISEKGKCLIPITLIINIKAFKQLLNENKITEPLNYDWSKFKISNKHQETILKKIKSEFKDKPLVIRSSATCEDSPLLSFAGQYSSFLNIKGKKRIIKAIKLCYQSLFSDNAKIYAKISHVKLENENMAIAIQELKPVIIAGVIFTVDPVNRDYKKVIVEYTEGLGDSIISGHKKPTQRIIKRTEIKNLKDIFLKKLFHDALILEKIFGKPQDIEWGWDGKNIYVFQSRNITTLNNQPKIKPYNFHKSKPIGIGETICNGLSKGPLRIIEKNKDYDKIKKGDIIFIKCKSDTSLIRKISLIDGLIIKGGVLSHMAVIAREFNIPCLTEVKSINEKIESFKNKEVIIDTSTKQILITQ